MFASLPQMKCNVKAMSIFHKLSCFLGKHVWSSWMSSTTCSRERCCKYCGLSQTMPDHDYERNVIGTTTDCSIDVCKNCEDKKPVMHSMREVSREESRGGGWYEYSTITEQVTIHIKKECTICGYAATETEDYLDEYTQT